MQYNNNKNAARMSNNLNDLTDENLNNISFKGDKYPSNRGVQTINSTRVKLEASHRELTRTLNNHPNNVQIINRNIGVTITPMERSRNLNSTKGFMNLNSNLNQNLTNQKYVISDPRGRRSQPIIKTSYSVRNLDEKSTSINIFEEKRMNDSNSSRNLMNNNIHVHTNPQSNSNFIPNPNLNGTNPNLRTNSNTVNHPHPLFNRISQSLNQQRSNKVIRLSDEQLKQHNSEKLNQHLRGINSRSLNSNPSVSENQQNSQNSQNSQNQQNQQNRAFSGSRLPNIKIETPSIDLTRSGQSSHPLSKPSQSGPGTSGQSQSIPSQSSPSQSSASQSNPSHSSPSYSSPHSGGSHSSPSRSSPSQTSPNSSSQSLHHPLPNTSIDLTRINPPLKLVKIPSFITDLNHTSFKVPEIPRDGNKRVRNPDDFTENHNNTNWPPNSSDKNSQSCLNQKTDPNPHQKPKKSHKRKGPEPRLKGGEECLVCSEPASGYHYGVLACEGCKGFFRRTTQKQLKFVCRMDETCALINLPGRRRCQSCRYAKCLKLGMLIYMEQTRIIAKCKETMRKQLAAQAANNYQPTTKILSPVKCTKETVQLKSENSNIYKNVDCTDSDLFQIEHLGEAFYTSLYPVKREEIANTFDRDDLPIKKQPKQHISHMTKIGTRQVAHYCFNLPEFVSLDVQEQTEMIRFSLLEVFWIRGALKYDHKSDTIVMGHNSFKNGPQVYCKDDWVKTGGHPLVVDEIYVLMKRMNSMVEGNHEVTGIFIAMILCNPDCPLLCGDTVEKMRRARDRYLHLLKVSCMKVSDKFPLLYPQMFTWYATMQELKLRQSMYNQYEGTAMAMRHPTDHLVGNGEDLWRGQIKQEMSKKQNAVEDSSQPINSKLSLRNQNIVNIVHNVINEKESFEYDTNNGGIKVRKIKVD